jgi:hypothetical protein
MTLFVPLVVLTRTWPFLFFISSLAIFWFLYSSSGVSFAPSVPWLTLSPSPSPSDYLQQQNKIDENSDDTAFPTRRFTNINDELEYYKSHAETIELELAETKFALEEFQFSSKELEEELEKEIDSTERRYNEIKIRNEAMRQEVEEWKVCC